MFKIEFKILKEFEAKGSILEADDMAFRYDHFCGNLSLKDANNTIEMNWGWIPILDFALSLKHIETHLFDGSKEEFEFTESNERLTFYKADMALKITTSFSDEALDIGWEQFKIGVANFWDMLTAEIANKNPGIKQNATYMNYFKS